MIHNTLVHEILKVMMGNLGFIPGAKFGTAGLSDDILKIEKIIKLEIGDAIVNLPVYAGQITAGDQQIRCMGTVIRSMNEPDEFSIVYQVDDLPPMGARCNFDDFEGMRMIRYHDGKWEDMSLFSKLMTCAGFEKITELGFIWKNLEEQDHLYPILVDIVEM